MSTERAIHVDEELQGTYAGVVTRAAGFAIDALVILGMFAIAGEVFDYLASAVFGADVAVHDDHVVAAVVLAGWAFLYCAYSLAAAGRTLGMAVVGLPRGREARRPDHGTPGDRPRHRNAFQLRSLLPRLLARTVPEGSSRAAGPRRGNRGGVRVGCPRRPTALLGQTAASGMTLVPDVDDHRIAAEIAEATGVLLGGAARQSWSPRALPVGE